MRHLVQVHPDGAERSGPRAHQRDHRGQDAGERYARPSRLPAPLFLRSERGPGSPEVCHSCPLLCLNFIILKTGSVELQRDEREHQC